MSSETCNIANPECLEFCPFAQGLQSDIVEVQADLADIEATARQASDLALTAMGAAAESAVQTVEYVKPVLQGFTAIFGQEAIETITEELIAAPARDIDRLAIEKINDLTQQALNLNATRCFDKVANSEMTSEEALEQITAYEQEHQSILREQEVAEMEYEAKMAKRATNILSNLAEIGITNIYDEDGNISADVIVAQITTRTDTDRKAITVLMEEWVAQLAQAKDCPGLQNVRPPGKIRKVTVCPSFSK